MGRAMCHVDVFTFKSVEKDEPNLSRIPPNLHRYRSFWWILSKKVVERTVWIDDVPGGEEYEVKKITTTATPISAASDLTTTTITSCVSSLPP